MTLKTLRTLKSDLDSSERNPSLLLPPKTSYFLL